MRERLPVLPKLEHFGGHAVVLVIRVRVVHERQVLCAGTVPVGISHRGLHVEQPGPPAIGPRETLIPSRARQQGTGEHDDLPVLLPRSGLNGEKMGVVRHEQPGGALHGRRPIGLGVVQLGDRLEDHAVAELGIDPVRTEGSRIPAHRIDAELSGLRIDGLVRPYGLVLILTRHDQYGVVRQLENRRIPPGILHVRVVRGLSRRRPHIPLEGEAILHRHGFRCPIGDGVAPWHEVERILLRGVRRVVEEGFIERSKQRLEVRIARRSGRPACPVAALGPRGPLFGLRIEDVDPVETVAAVHVVAAGGDEPPVGERGTSVAIQVAPEPLRVASVLERVLVQKGVPVGQRRDVVLPAVLERIRMAEVPQLRVLDPPIVGNPPRNAAAVADDAEAAVHPPGVRLPDCALEVAAWIVERSVYGNGVPGRVGIRELRRCSHAERQRGRRIRSRPVDQLIQNVWVDHIVSPEFRMSEREEYLRRRRSLLPEQPPVHRRRMRENQGAQQPAGRLGVVCRIAVWVRY